MDNAQPIIVKKINKGGHGHHGGAWKVAFADFVTAMMAFFLLLWLMGSTTPEEKAAISDFFQNPSAVQGPGGASSSMIKLGGIDAELKKKEKEKEKGKGETSEAKPDSQTTETVVVEREVEVQKDAQRLDGLKKELEKAIASSEAMKPFKDQLLLDITTEGLRIQIIDKEGRPMFDVGSSRLKDYTGVILKEIANLIDKVPNKISLTGHTDATPYNNMLGYSNWELSTDRANASRRALVFGGLRREKVAKVLGLSSTVLFDKKNPKNPVNRRISLIVLNKAAEEALMRDGAAEVAEVADVDDTKDDPQAGAKPMLPAEGGAPAPKSLTPKSLESKSASPRNLGPKTRQPRTIGKPAASSETREPKGTAAGTKNPQRSQSIRPIIPIVPIAPITPIKLP